MPGMLSVPEFTREDALALQELLASPSRPRDTMGYFESAGFLFAVCCNPDVVQASEWMPEVLGEEYGDLADLEEAQRALRLLMGLYNDINRGVFEHHPELPWGCDVRPEPLANLEEDAPLARWARGFARGYDWLQESWPDDLPSDLDQALGTCLVVLTFFSRRSLAEAYWKDTKRADFPFDAMAGKMHAMLHTAMLAYADLGRSLEQGAPGKPPASRAAKGGRAAGKKVKRVHTRK
jgi:yecA family protein